MPYVDRDKDNKITGIFIPKQYPNQEYLSDDNPEIIAFRSPKPIGQQGLAMIFEDKAELMNEFDSATTINQLKAVIRKILFEGGLSEIHGKPQTLNHQ